MNTLTMVKPRDVVVTKKVLDVYEMPYIDLSKLPKLEVTDNGQGKVFLDGVLLAGVKLMSYDESGIGRFIQAKTCTARLLVVNTNLDIILRVESVILTDGNIPTTAKLVRTEDT